MGKYELKTTDGETIKTIKANDIHEAILLFAEMKKLSTITLLEIFDVVTTID